VALTAATFCERPEAPTCAVRDASLLIRPAGVSAWSRIQAELAEGAYRFSIPGDLVPADGFAYWIEVVTEDGERVAYPPGGEETPVRVVTTEGLPETKLAAFDWDDRQRAVGTVVRMPYGDADGQAGLTGGEGDQALDGPSSFEVLPGGGVAVVDWVNDRIQTLDARGRFVRSVPLPEHVPMDVALPGDGYALSGLGMDATVFELTSSGAVRGRYPLGYGIATRITTSRGEPRVLVGQSQWAGVRGAPGSPLDADSQARMATSTVPLEGGDVALSDSTDRNSVAFVWTRPDGSRAGVVVHLPKGVFAGTDYFVRPLPDGGAVAARGLWDGTHSGIGILRFDATGEVASFGLLPEPSIRMAAHASVVRFAGDRGVYVAFDEDDALRIDRFEVR
jgi:hypothetical protein